jgi:hypothetical protein
MSWIKDVKLEVSVLDTSKASLRRFYRLMLIVFFILASIASAISNFILLGIGIGGLLLFSIAVFSKAAIPMYKTWMGLAFALGWIMSRVLLFLVFYIVITPIALLARISGKKFLDTKFRDGKDSYWIKRDDPSVDYTKMS